MTDLVTSPLGRLRRFKEIALNAATVIVTIAAVTMVGIRVHEKFFTKAAASTQPRQIANWRDFAKEGQRIGPSNATVTIVEFTDFQCPFCRRAAEDLKEIRRQFPDRVAIVVRHFPIEGHKFAPAAALAAECAGKQGAFEAYHDLLFASQKAIGSEAWTSFAAQAGVSDATAFAACLSDPANVARLERDRAAAGTLGVVGTPTLLINDLAVSGYPGEGRLAALVQSALDGDSK